jgi:hypothetical protein
LKKNTQLTRKLNVSRGNKAGLLILLLAFLPVNQFFGGEKGNKINKRPIALARCRPSFQLVGAAL